MQGRVVLIGEAQVGKTSLLERFLQSECDDAYQPTVGATFHARHVQVAGSMVLLQIWDTAGQEKYRALGPIYYRNALAAIAVFDQTRPSSLENLQTWIDAYRESADDKFVIIAANKADLESDIVIPLETIDAWAKRVHADFQCTSAVTGTGVAEVFNAVAAHIMHVAETIPVSYQPPPPATDEGGGCC